MIGTGRTSDPIVTMTLSRQVLEQLVALSSDGVLVADAQTADLRIVYVNAAYEDLTGYRAAELIGQPWPLMAAPADGQPELGALKAAVGRGMPAEARLLDMRADGTRWPSEIRVIPYCDRPGHLRYFLCIGRPARECLPAEPGLEVGLLRRELGRAQQKITSLSRIEPVTGLPKLEHFIELARRDMQMARRDRRRIAILLIEIVELDAYRGTFGDKAAESCLRMVGAQVQGMLRRNGDLCARFEASSVIALVHGQNEAEAETLASRIADNVRGLGLHNPRARNGRHVEVSVAVAARVPDAEDVDSLIEEARSKLVASARPRAASRQA